MAGAAGLEPTTPGFGDQCSAKLSYAPTLRLRLLLRLAVKCMASTARTVTTQLDAAGVVSLVLLRRIRALLALSAGEINNNPRFSFSSHVYSIMRLKVPAPTVLPPSRIAKRKPFSRATG